MKVAFLQLGQGGRLRHTMADVPHSGSRWDASPAPTVTLYTANGGVLQALTSANAGPSTALSSAASSGSYVLPLSSTAKFERWNDYVVGPNAAGQWEWVSPDGVGSGQLTTLEPLTYDYLTSVTVKSHELYTVVTSATVPSVEYHCRADWKYSLSGVPRVDSTVFHVSRYAPRFGLTASAVRRRDPRVAEVIGDGQRVDLLIRQLWEERLLPDLFKLWRPGATVAGSECDEALFTLIEEQVARKARDFEAAEHYRSDYVAQLDTLRQTLLDLDEDGAKESDELPRSAYNPRLLRG